MFPVMVLNPTLDDGCESGDGLADSASFLALDPSSACNHAYYAMFYAARAALSWVGQPERAAGKSHSGMIASFGQYLVVPGLISPEHGRAFGRVEQRRLAGDYLGTDVPLEVATDAVTHADAFVTAVRNLMADQMN
jgi:uncharacterized protein (UPF0332 family)